MTHLIFILFFSVYHLIGYNDTNQNIMKVPKSNISPAENRVSDSLLFDIQNKIYNAFIKGRMSNTNEALNNLNSDLETMYKTKKLGLILYWQSYLQFFSSINYLSKSDSKSAATEIGKGIELLNSVEKKNSEDYALLAMLQSFSMQFDFSRAMVLSEETAQNASLALSLDTANIRAWYILASNDFYTPEQYGGGKKAEKYLLKAISLPSQKINNNYLPSWGKEESYEMLIKLYIKNEKWDLAKKYFQEGKEAFPKSYTIGQLASRLNSK
jgi:hypothetical protein